MIALSASKVVTYLQCPRRYKFRYVARIPTPWKASALALGSAVHSTLEAFHLQRAAGVTMLPSAVGGLFRIDLAAELLDDIRFRDDEDAEDLATMGEALVKLYAAANQNLNVKAAEVPFELPLSDTVLLRGVFDVLLDGDRVRELKTAARDYDAGTLARHIQISAYCWAYPRLFGREATLEVVTMLKTKQPRIETHEVTRTVAEQAWFVQLALEVARAIELDVYPARPSWACSSCEYAEPCAG